MKLKQVLLDHKFHKLSRRFCFQKLNPDLNFPNLKSEFKNLLYFSRWNVLTSFFIYLTHIFGRKKSAQISILSTPMFRKTMFPVDWCTQIVFLIFLKKTKAQRPPILVLLSHICSLLHTHYLHTRRERDTAEHLILGALDIHLEYTL